MILGTSWSGFGALLIVVGAVLVLGDAAANIGMTWGGTRPSPRARAAVAISRVGPLSAAIGSIILAVDSGVSLLAVVVVLAAVAALTYLEMARQLRKHRLLLAEEALGVDGSLRWCLCHPRWRPDRSPQPSLGLKWPKSWPKPWP